jgi:type I restriction enzyme S subunit
VNLNWTIAKIEEIAEVNPRLGKAGIPDDLPVSFVPMPAVGAGDGSIDVSQVRPFGEVKKGFTSFQQGDVLFAKITPCMENGKMAIVPKVENGYAFGSTEFHVLRPKPGIDARYIYYYVSSRRFRGEAEHQMSGAVGQKRVPTQYMRECTIPLAPLNEQTRIVAEIEKQFSRLDEAVANLKRVKANLKRYKAAVLKAAVEGKLTEEWRRRGGIYPAQSEGCDDQGVINHAPTEPIETGAELLERILEERRSNWQGRGKYKEPVGPDTSGLPELPVGWVWASVSELLVEPIVNGLSIKESPSPTEVRALRLSAMTDEGFDFTEYRFLPTKLDQVAGIVIREGDFFVSRGNGSLHLVGRSTVAQSPPFDVIFPDTMMRLRLAEPIRLSEWLKTIWSSAMVRRQIEGRVKTTAGIYKVSQPELASITVPLPPLTEQQQIVAEVERRLSIVAGAETQVDANLRRADRLRQSILKQAFSGALV